MVDTDPPATSASSRIVAAVARLIAIADDPADTDDTRLRKRVGVTAGYVTVVAPLTEPFQAGLSAAS